VDHKLIRELIRLANREGFDAEDVTDLIHLAEMLLAQIRTEEDRELVTAEHIMEFWKESFEDVEP
jgi:hypothetical protein